VAQLSRGGAVAGWFRKYPLAPRYGRAQRLALEASDGTRLAGHRLAGPPDAAATVVLVHGFVNSSRTPAVHAFAHLLADEVDVIVPDLRGHGRSAGVCTFGRDEPLDVAAAVAVVDPAKPVVTVGVSLGGAAVLLHAGRHPGAVAGVVAISAPVSWGGVGTPGAQRIERWVGTPRGRLVLRTLLNTRLAPPAEGAGGGAPPDAAAVAAGIAPAFTIVVADPDDWYFGPEHPEAIHRWAQDPKELWWYPGGGHGTDLLTTAFAARLLAAIDRHLA
jgi:pimeloyl-ACP methyl ester carboxylesterase